MYYNYLQNGLRSNKSEYGINDSPSNFWLKFGITKQFAIKFYYRMSD